MSPAPRKSTAPATQTRPELVRQLIDVAMEFERRTMQIYCRFESMFQEPEEVRAFWFDMAQHESRHFGALALVGGLLDGAKTRSLPAVPALTKTRLKRLRSILDGAEKAAGRETTLTRAFEIALDIESSEIEDLVLDLLSSLKGKRERERAVHLLIHDLGDLSYMIEKHGNSKELLGRADKVIEQQLGRLRGRPVATARSGNTPRRRRTRS
jgi:rubrerythrin